MSAAPHPLRLGTRASPLARWQAEWVAAQLTKRGASVELVPITTQGDVKSAPLGQIGGQGLFTKELQRALLDQTIDLAVHSLKDLPTSPIPGLIIAAVPERESVRDVLVSVKAQSIAELPRAARIGTGSLRRKSQLLYLRPDLVIEDIRGNVETRLRKLDEGQYDALILAEAGLKRLDFEHRITCPLPATIMLSAVGQGALGIEARAHDRQTLDWVGKLNHEASHQAITAERTLLAELRAGCLAPVGAWARLEGERMQLDAVVLNPQGSERITASGAGNPAEATELGRRVAAQLQSQGAADLINAAHRA